MAKKKDSKDASKSAQKPKAAKAAARRPRTPATKPATAASDHDQVPVEAAGPAGGTTVTGGGTTISREQIPPQTLTRDMIARRAYEIYCARGRVDGHAQQDWIQAERELVELAKGER